MQPGLTFGANRVDLLMRDGPGRNVLDADGGSVECNVRVVVRVRPLVARERLAGATESLEVIPGTPQIVVNPEHSYSFDQVNHNYNGYC